MTPAGEVDERLAGPRIEAAGLTHVGRVRERNEDAWAVMPAVFVVADGMGGHEGGDAASRLVVESFGALRGRDRVDASAMERCVARARELIERMAGDRPAPPGSTVVAAGRASQDGVEYWLIANIGDSRAYTYADGVLRQVSHDHSVVQELVDAGRIDAAQAHRHPDRHVITRAIGALEDSPVEFYLVPLREGGRLLLCSDGLTSEVSDDRVAVLLGAQTSAEQTCHALVDAALQAGGRDNVTVVVVDVAGESTDEDTLTRLDVVSDTVRTGGRRCER